MKTLDRHIYEWSRRYESITHERNLVFGRPLWLWIVLLAHSALGVYINNIGIPIAMGVLVLFCMLEEVKA